MKKLFLFALINLFTNVSYAQQLAYFDAAQAYNRLLVEKNNGTYTRVGTYKVIGTPHLFGEKIQGSLSAQKEFAENISLSYNTYDQKVSFRSSANSQTELVKEAEEIDSFEVYKNTALNLNESMKFISGRHLAADENSLFRILYKGDKYSLYKKYKSVLSIVSTNYIDAELRQFDLQAEYFYYDTAEKKSKKFKIAHSNLVKEFGKNKVIESIIDKDALVLDTDNTLIAIFAALNK